MKQSIEKTKTQKHKTRTWHILKAVSGARNRCPCPLLSYAMLLRAPTGIVQDCSMEWLRHLMSYGPAYVLRRAQKPPIKPYNFTPSKGLQLNSQVTYILYDPSFSLLAPRLRPWKELT